MPWPCCASILCNCYLICGLPPRALYQGAAFAVVASVFFFSYSCRHSKLGGTSRLRHFTLEEMDLQQLSDSGGGGTRAAPPKHDYERVVDKNRQQVVIIGKKTSASGGMPSPVSIKGSVLE
ncbi:unnamed protein product [Amoebophrya sp. A25]|nr:unnamed protein product [Amoebophrya sp. A25]|eukprot:GSA25T00001678001.1